MKWLVMIIVLILPPAVKSNVKNDLQKAKLKGKVSCVTYFETFVGDSLERQRSIHFYNKSGNEITSIHFLGETIIDSVIWKYDEQGKGIEEKSKSSRTEYMYDVNGALLESKRYKTDDGSLMESMFFRHDANGNDSEIISYGCSGAKNYRMVTQIATNGDRIETVFDMSGNVEQKYEYKYDTDSNLKLSMSYMNLDGRELKETVEYFYYGFDKRGNWTFRKCSASREKLEYELFEKRVIEYYQ